ncbi:molybdate ABC transporter permease subunit [bacterium]|nr:molybdate ABC transporter permease subunit [bacterium]
MSGGGRWTRRLLIGAALAYVGGLVAAPFVALAAGALQDGPLELFRALFSAESLGPLVLTVKIGLICVAFHVVAGALTAWALVRDNFPGRRFVSGLVDLPFALSPVVVGYMLLLIFGRRGLLGPALAAVGWQVAFDVSGMVLATLFVTLPLMVRELMPALAALGTEQEQAAATLGASGWQTFLRVTLPSLRWGFVYGAALTFARALGEFGAVLVVGGGVQGKTETATLYIYRALEERQYVAAYGAALGLGAISMALMLGVDLLRRRRG